MDGVKQSHAQDMAIVWTDAKWVPDDLKGEEFMVQRCSGTAHFRGGGVGRRLGAGGAGAAASSLSSSSALGLVLSLRVPKPPKKDFAGFSTASGTSASSTTYNRTPQLASQFWCQDGRCLEP